MHQVSTLNPRGEYNMLYRVVTERRGSWKWQDAFRRAGYVAVQKVDGSGFYWKSVERSYKFAKLRSNAHMWRTCPDGSLHGRPARPVVDDFGDLVFVA